VYNAANIKWPFIFDSNSISVNKFNSKGRNDDEFKVNLTVRT